MSELPEDLGAYDSAGNYLGDVEPRQAPPPKWWSDPEAGAAEVVRRKTENQALDADILKREAAKGRFVRTNTNDLMARTFAPIKWVVPGYLSEGFLFSLGVRSWARPGSPLI